jgi:hypothetical protein
MTNVSVPWNYNLRDHKWTSPQCSFRSDEGESSPFRDSQCGDSDYKLDTEICDRSGILTGGSCTTDREGCGSPDWCLPPCGDMIRWKCYRHKNFHKDADPVDCCTDAGDPYKCAPGWFTGSGECLPILKSYCQVGDRILDDPKCGYLKSLSEATWADQMAKVCQGDTLRRPECEAFSRTDAGWPRCIDAIRQHCKDKTPADVADRRVCGCNYDSQIYSTFYNDVLRKYQVGPAGLTQTRKCFFPLCGAAVSDVPGQVTCPNYDIQRCVNQFTLEVDGSISGDTVLTQTCGAQIPERASCT